MVLDSAAFFNIHWNGAREALKVMAEIIMDQWRHLASELGMTTRDIRTRTPAFESPQVQEALRL